MDRTQVHQVEVAGGYAFCHALNDKLALRFVQLTQVLDSELVA